MAVTINFLTQNNNNACRFSLSWHGVLTDYPIFLRPLSSRYACHGTEIMKISKWQRKVNYNFCAVAIKTNINHIEKSASDRARTCVKDNRPKWGWGRVAISSITSHGCYRLYIELSKWVSIRLPMILFQRHVAYLLDEWRARQYFSSWSCNLIVFLFLGRTLPQHS